MMEQSLVVI